jgi:hypothetical protein
MAVVAIPATWSPKSRGNPEATLDPVAASHDLERPRRGFDQIQPNPGWVAERFKAPVLKTGVPARVPWVRIPPHPPASKNNPKRLAQAVKWQRRPGLHADGHGLYLPVGRRGTKSWIYRYRRDGRLRDMGLGSSAKRRARNTVCRCARRRRAKRYLT